MVLPVVSKTWPTINRVDSYGFSLKFVSRVGQTQARPIDRPLTYDCNRADASCSNSALDNTHGASAFDYKMSTFPPSVVNTAYERLRGKLYDSAGLGVDIVEYRQSLAMIAKRGSSLYRAFKHVKRFDFPSASKELKLSFVPKGASKRKAVADNWLEYHFGWSPLLSDVHDAAKVMSNPFKEVSARGTAQSEEKFDSGESGSFYSYNIKDGYKRRYYCVQGCRMSVTNPNLHLADQMGLINPLSLAWEVVPFSFVVDWFASVGSFLGALTDFAGCSLQQGYTTRTCKGSRVWVKTTNPPPAGPYPGYSVMAKSYGLYTTRSIGITTPILAIKPIKLFSPSRALTSWALLVQIAERHK